MNYIISQCFEQVLNMNSNTYLRIINKNEMFIWVRKPVTCEETLLREIVFIVLTAWIMYSSLH
jgi:hypothetical protein